MRLLYSGFENLIRKAEELSPKLVDLPFITEVKINMIFLGTIGDLTEVELKADKKTLGWLYKKETIIFFIHGDHLYEIFWSTLKDIVEEKLITKKFLIDGASPAPGLIKRYPDGRMIGYIATSDLIAVANKITDQEGRQ